MTTTNFTTRTPDISEKEVSVSRLHGRHIKTRHPSIRSEHTNVRYKAMIVSLTSATTHYIIVLFTKQLTSASTWGSKGYIQPFSLFWPVLCTFPHIVAKDSALGLGRDFRSTEDCQLPASIILLYFCSHGPRGGGMRRPTWDRERKKGRW